LLELMMEKLHLYQSEIYEVVQTENDMIVISLNDGREIYIKSRPTNYGYAGIHDVRIKEAE
jgi:hypothetical protein